MKSKYGRRRDAAWRRDSAAHERNVAVIPAHAHHSKISPFDCGLFSQNTIKSPSNLVHWISLITNGLCYNC